MVASILNWKLDVIFRSLLTNGNVSKLTINEKI